MKNFNHNRNAPDDRPVPIHPVFIPVSATPSHSADPALGGRPQASSAVKSGGVMGFLPYRPASGCREVA